MSESFDYRPSGMLAATGYYPDFNVASVGRKSVSAHLQKLCRQAEWLQYEVDPEWSRFCSFGPDDIGGPWEKLGVIRRKPRVDVLYLSPDVMNGLKNYVRVCGAPNDHELKFLMGVPLVEDFNLPSGTAIGGTTRDAYRVHFDIIRRANPVMPIYFKGLYDA